MTDRLRRERELPEGYQFGDACESPVFRVGKTVSIKFHHAAAWLTASYVRQFDVQEDRTPMRFPCIWPEGWNVIEGEHETTHIGFDPASKRTWEP